jgi:membrane-associated HD superfamily phosphohydrolase
LDYLVKKYRIASFGIAAINILLLPGIAFLYNKTLGEILRIEGFSILFTLGFLYVLFYNFKLKRFDYDNLEHPYRFFLIFFISFALSMVFPLIDEKGWVFLSIAIAISLFSNSFIGLYCLSGLTFFTILLSNSGNAVTFFVYFLSAFIGIILFSDIDQNFSVGHSIFISSLYLFILESFGFVMLENKDLTAESFIMPIVNIMINAIVLFGFLKSFNALVVNKYRNRFLILNDQEYFLIRNMKEKSKKDYLRSIHSAYLSERIAKAVGCNVDVCKNLAYYHRINKAFNLSNEGCKKLFIENQFPPEAIIALTDFLKRDSNLESKESCIVYLADRLISDIQAILDNNKSSKEKTDYVSVINKLFEDETVKKTLSESLLSLRDIKIAREIMLKEKLYYDFLR